MVGDEAVDLTAARSHHEDEEDMAAREPEEVPVPPVTAIEEEDDADPEPEDPENDDRPEESGSTRKKLRSESQETDDEEGSRKRMRLCEDAENNNSFIEGGPPADVFPPPGTSHVTLEALQNTKVAVAQFAATALAGGADSEAALQELAALQNTLYTLQHQQAFQLQLISQLQQQLTINTHQQSATTSDQADPSGDDVPSDSKETSPSPIIQPKPLSALTSPPDSRPPSSHHRTSPVNTLTGQVTHHELPPRTSPSPSNGLPQPPACSTPTALPTASVSQQQSVTAPLCSISSSLASSIITNNDPLPINEPNTLEMLQKRAQEVLDNASQGLLANNLADELAFRGSKGSRLSPYDSKNGGGRSEPFFKHRCRYCGKVFGSDSALQIHIRSHTGERPFKCNVCGSRFTTKGNLKVHFQRHRDKFPHVKMNPNPVPEHLDKYHPPLLQQLAACGQRPLTSPPPPPPPPPMHPSSSLFHHPPPPGFLPPHQPPIPLGLGLHGGIPPLYRGPLINHRDDQDVPENLSKSSPVPSPGAHSNHSHHSFQDHYRLQLQQRDDSVKEEPSREPSREPSPENDEEEEEIVQPKPEPQDDEDVEDNPEPEQEDFGGSPRSMVNNEDCSLDSSKLSGKPDDPEESDQPENLSGRDNPASMLQQTMTYPGASPAGSHSSSESGGSLQNSFANMLYPGQAPPTVEPTRDPMDPARDPAIYSNLLPRPGSNDNSWESLIEITKTSETSKLQQLVDNIEHKLTDPNQCIICQRVLSCKSALQMHYRTHTGERPFKCKICGRAFTTKGNLKTHMGVHRAKPPLRLLHQCTVCHKKFANSFVLQQHVNLHTNDPTELTPEQIRAAEIHDFPPGYPPHPLAAFLPGGFPPLHPGGFPMGFPPPPRPHSLDNNDMDSKEALQHQQLQHQFQLQQQRYLEEQMDDLDDSDDDEEELKEEDDRSEENRDKRSIDGGEDLERDDDPEDQDREEDMPSFSTSLAALANQVRTITTTASSIMSKDASPPKSPNTPNTQFNGSEKSVSPTGNLAAAPLDLTPRAASTPSFVTTSAPVSPPAQSAAVPHPSGTHPFGLFSGLLQSATTSPTLSNNVNCSGSSVMSPASLGVGPLASLTSSAVRAATSTYNPLGLAVGGSAGRRSTKFWNGVATVEGKMRFYATPYIIAIPRLDIQFQCLITALIVFSL